MTVREEADLLILGGGFAGALMALTARRIGLHRVGSPQDVTALVVFLATCEPCYITGQDFKVDGFQYNM